MTVTSGLLVSAGVTGAQAKKLWPVALAMTEATLVELRHAMPDQVGVLGERTRRFVAVTLHRTIVRTAGDPRAAADWDEDAELFREVGAAEYAAGRNLNRIYRACGAGGRRALPILLAFLRERAFPTRDVFACVDALFGCLEGLTALATAGYATAQANDPGERARQRGQLLQGILTGAPQLDTLSQAARWPLPEDVVVVALEPGAPDPGDAALSDLDDAEPCALLPGDRADALPAFGTRAAVGPRVPLADAAVSLCWARKTLDLVRRGVLPDHPVTRWTEHLATHWMLVNKGLTGALADRALAPLARMSPDKQAKASDTLLALITSRGGATEIARQLGIHPQTARYRIQQLTTLFGTRLDDPEERLALEIGLRARKLVQHEQNPAK